MRLTSVRVRLTLWNMAALAIALLCFGVGVQYTVRHEVSASVTRGLTERAQHLADRWTQGNRQMLRAIPKSPITANTDPSDLFRGPRIVDLNGRPLVPGAVPPVWDRAAAERSLTGETVFSQVRENGYRARVISVPLRRGGRMEGVLQLAYSMQDLNNLLTAVAATLLALLPAALVFAALGGLFLAGRALAPVRRIGQTAREISARDLSRRLPVSGNDEFSELAVTFNAMVARLEQAFQSLQQSLEQQRRLIADASHELRTPLTTIIGNTSLALTADRTAEEYRRTLESTDRAAATMNRIVQDLLLLARSDAGRFKLDREPTPVGELLERSIESAAVNGGPTVHLEPPDPDLEVMGEGHYLVRLFANLVENAVRHTPSPGQVSVRARAEDDQIVIVIQDNGEGIAPEHLPHITERFYRAEGSRSRSGSGLGLAISQSIVQAHGGTMIIESKVGVGTTVTVRLPRAPTEDSDLSPPGRLAGRRAAR
ncbi:MAG TPA: HAMP domain-containing sensor histidine kinase [Armatimonadota bacterium]|nr:HAMP domain-containing sensor histidine kinase [Armatimonadota bacterium]